MSPDRRPLRFGDSALCDDQIQPVSVVALEATVVLSLARKQYTTFVESCPSQATLSLSIGGPSSSASSSSASTASDPNAAAKIDLKELPFFRGIPLHKLHQLACMFEFRRFGVGDYICRQV